MANNFSKHIPHFEDMKIEEVEHAIQLIKKNKLLVTEKIDGFSCSLGNDEIGPFVASKNLKFRNPEEIGNLAWFLQPFKKYVEEVKSIDFAMIPKICKIKTRGQNVSMVGEALPSHDFNIVQYDKDYVADGIFVIYAVEIDNKTVTHEGTLQQVCKFINRHSQIKFIPNPLVNLGKKPFDEEVLYKILKLIRDNQNVLKAAARTPRAKDQKAKVRKEITSKLKELKKSILDADFPSELGNDPEGLVFHNEKGPMFKMVDKEKFTSEKEKNWVYLNRIFTAEKTFVTDINKNTKHFYESLEKYEATIKDISLDFSTVGKNTFSIPKKIEDTEKALTLEKTKVEYIKKFAVTKTVKELIDIITRRELLTLISDKMSQEQHSAVPGVNSLIPREYLEPTIQFALQMIGLQNISFKVVGSADKDYLGDIDLAIDAKELAVKWRLKQDEGFTSGPFFEGIKKRLELKTVDYSVNRGLRQFHILAPVVDLRGKEIDAITPGTLKTLEGVPARIQFDFFVGDMRWMEKLLSGAPGESKYKATHRNILLSNTVNYCLSDVDSGIKYALDYKNGLNKKKVSLRTTARGSTKEEVLNVETVTSDPQKLIRMLFNETRWNMVSSFEGLYTQIMGNSFKFPEKRDIILENTVLGLISQKKAVPVELSSVVESLKISGKISD
jgi:hypothetical protein